MRINKYLLKSFLVAVLISSAMQSCTFKNEIDTDPNNPKTAPLVALLSPAELLVSYTWGGNLSRLDGMFTQSLEGVDRQAYGIYNYTFVRSDVDDPWDNLYRALLSSRDVINLAGESSPYYTGIGKVIKAFALGTLTSHYGDIPNSQAVAADLGITQPKYDNQQDVYTYIQILLDEAILDLSASSSTFLPGVDDLIYGGDINKWLNLAKALKARYYIHTAKKDPANYSKALNVISSGNFLTTASGFSNFEQVYIGSSATSQAPWYQWRDQRDDILPNQLFLDSLLKYSDGRADIYMQVTTAGGVKGFGDYLMGPDAAVVMFSTTELYFIAAEAAFQTGDLNAAVDALNGGISSSFAETGALGTAPLFTVANISLNVIMTQKWLALWLNPEAFVDWRRTGFPILKPVDGTAVPRKFPYPQKEMNYNGKNVPSEATVPYLTKMWIDS